MNEHHSPDHEHATHHQSTQHNDSNQGREEKEKSKKSTRNLIILLLGIVLICGIIYAVGTGINSIIYKSKYADRQLTYNNFQFTKAPDGLWVTQMSIKGAIYDIPFHYNPTEVLDIPVQNGTHIANMFGKLRSNPNATVYVVVDPTQKSTVVVAGVEIARILGTAYDIYNLNVQSGFLQSPRLVNETEVNTNATKYPIITCADQNTDVVVIEVDVGSQTQVSFKDHCIKVTGSTLNETVRAADALALRLLAIIRQ